MTKKEKVLSVTDEINGKAKEIMKQGDKTSLEAKRFEFCNFLDEYYDKLSGSSELLITRKEEINFFTTTSKDFYTSIPISLITSIMTSFIFWCLEESEKISDATQNEPLITRLIFPCIIVILIIVFILWFSKTLINVHNERKKLSDYEKLNAKEYEIEIIDKLLEQRFDEYKVGVKSKLEATDETEI